MTMLRETMNPDVARKLLKVGGAFRIQGPFFSYEEIKMGNVNHTYKVNYIRDDGSGCKNRHPSPICTRFEHHFAGVLVPLSRTEAPPALSEF